MAIPIRTTLTCPVCGASEDTTFADVSVGPNGRTSKAPLYSGLPDARWSCPGNGPDDKISCRTCGARDFITLRQQARGWNLS